ncbi:MAG: discoidin domain-containing protein, partial [Candidatus Omnitrophica bacterium]|nr:discoidin domain-containing protein [Candidatus Omnitrophota bacterium]
MFRKNKKNNFRTLKRVSLTLFFCLLATSLYAQTELTISSATASSTYGSNTASKVIDKKLNTYWQGASGKSYWWLSLDLGKTCALEKLSLWWHKDYGSTNYNLQGSNDNSNWTNLLTGLSSSGGTTNPYQKDHTISGNYRYLRIYINKAQKSYPIIYEVKLYGKNIIDTTPPDVSITSPASGSTVSGMVEIKAEAKDNIGIAKVDFYLDDALKSSDTTSPYSYSWDSATVSNGSHTIKVIASDFSSNSKQAQITLKTDNFIIPPANELTISSATASSTYGSNTAS